MARRLLLALASLLSFRLYYAFVLLRHSARRKPSLPPPNALLRVLALPFADSCTRKYFRRWARMSSALTLIQQDESRQQLLKAVLKWALRSIQTPLERTISCSFAVLEGQAARAEGSVEQAEGATRLATVLELSCKRRQLKRCQLVDDNRSTVRAALGLTTRQLFEHEFVHRLKNKGYLQRDREQWAARTIALLVQRKQAGRVHPCWLLLRACSRQLLVKRQYLRLKLWRVLLCASRSSTSSKLLAFHCIKRRATLPHSVDQFRVVRVIQLRFKILYNKVNAVLAGRAAGVLRQLLAQSKPKKAANREGSQRLWDMVRNQAVVCARIEEREREHTQDTHIMAMRAALQGVARGCRERVLQEGLGRWKRTVMFSGRQYTEMSKLLQILEEQNRVLLQELG